MVSDLPSVLLSWVPLFGAAWLAARLRSMKRISRGLFGFGEPGSAPVGAIARRVLKRREFGLPPMPASVSPTTWSTAAAPEPVALFGSDISGRRPYSVLYWSTT